MTKLKKITTVVIIVYSISIFLLSTFSVVFSYYLLGSDSYFKFFLGEIVNLDIWQLNCYVLGFLLLSAGAIGIISGVLIWKGKEGAQRFWLFLISWQFILSFVIGSPYLPSTIIVGCLCGWSWFVFCRPTFKVLLVNSKCYLLECLLIITILSQTLSIAILNKHKDDISSDLAEESVGPIIKRGMQKAVMVDFFGKHYEKYFEFEEHYDKKDGKSLRQCGEFLLKHGYEKDRWILSALAAESYSRGQLTETVNFLKSAIDGDYAKGSKPSEEKYIYFNQAQLHYMLHLVYGELGESNKSETEYNLSAELFKKFYGDKFSVDLLKRRMETSKRTLNHFKIEGDG